jgi:hypothetical protein
MMWSVSRVVKEFDLSEHMRLPIPGREATAEPVATEAPKDPELKEAIPNWNLLHSVLSGAARASHVAKSAGLLGRESVSDYE